MNPILELIDEHEHATKRIEELRTAGRLSSAEYHELSVRVSRISTEIAMQMRKRDRIVKDAVMTGDYDTARQALRDG